MALMRPPICDFGWKAPDFSLKGVDGKTWSLERVRGKNGTLVMFICNHCPYVKAIVARLAEDAAALAGEGIGVVAIMPNDTDAYPDDSFDRMADFARAHAFGFPYVIDETQEVARAYDAVCTPDFFGFDAKDGLQYRGRLDAYHMEPPPESYVRELYDAMCGVAKTGRGPEKQTPSMGCSIKWRE